jgi:hypothetical protein
VVWEHLRQNIADVTYIVVQLAPLSTAINNLLNSMSEAVFYNAYLDNKHLHMVEIHTGQVIRRANSAGRL